MKNLIPFLIFVFALQSCENKIEKQKNIETIVSDAENKTDKNVENQTGKKSTDFVPNGYTVFKEITGDLNKDSLDDIVLIIKGTDKSKIIQHESYGKLDRNRRGIIVLFNKGNHYKVAVKNYDCFSSENEDGGGYFPPELFIEIKKGNLHINYAHGKYGGWGYTFRYQNSNFEMIGYDLQENQGPITQYQTSINFLTKKKFSRENINQDFNQDNYKENFAEGWEDISSKKLIKLSEVEDFDELESSDLYTIQ